MLKKGDVDYVVKVKSPVDVSEVDVFKTLGRRALLFFDIYPREVYLEKFDPRRPLEELYGSVKVLLSLAALAERSREAGAGLYVLAVVHDKALAETYEGKAVREWLGGDSFYVPRLNTPEFLAGVLKSYACPNEDDCCLGKVDIERLVSLISSHDAYTLVAKYAGLWLRERGCDVSDVERAVEEAKREPKLFLARYIRDVLLWRSSEEERVRLMYRVAVPLFLHAVFGPVPEGVTYITQARDGVVFYQPEEIEKFTKPQWDLLKAGLQPIAKWLAQRHEDLVEETLRDLAGLNGEEARKPYKETLSGLMEALDWARGEVLKEGGEILAELGVPEKDRGLDMSLLAFVNRRLAAVFKGGEGRRCWERAAFIAGHALAVHPVLPRREQLREDVAEALGGALKLCAVDVYLTIDGKIPTLSILVVSLPYYVEALYAKDLPQIRRIRERLGVLSPFADAETVNAAKKTAEGLVARWRRRGFGLREALHALGLAALAAGGEADEETADLLLYAASFAVQEVARLAAVLPVLAALRPLGEKAPHRYVVALAAASELERLYPETAQYIYYALQQHRDRLLEAERRWPLVEAIDAYSNLLTIHSEHIEDRLKDAVADMCRLYGEVGKRDAAAAPDRGLSAQRLFNAVTGARVLAAALYSDVLAPLVQRHCGLGDLVEEAGDVRKTLEAARPDELRKIAESDAYFAEWVTARSVTGNAGRLFEELRSWFTSVLARYELDHSLDERGELDAEKLEEVAGEFEKTAEMRRELEDWGNYLTASGLALGARVLAAKSWEELLEKAEGFRDLWREAEERLELTAGYLAKAAGTLGECLVYLAASGDKERAEELLKKWRWLLDYVPEVSVNTRLMLRLFGVGDGARLKEAVDVFEQELSLEFLPALWLLAGRLQRDKVSDECNRLSNAQLSKAEVCDIIVAAAAGNRAAAEMLRSVLEKVVPEAHQLIEKADGRTLVEVLAPEFSWARLAFMLLAAVEGRTKAVRLHGLLGSAEFRRPLARRLFRAVYENCGDLNSEGCRMALLKLYYYHI
jgi:hypothetical protein